MSNSEKKISLVRLFYHLLYMAPFFAVLIDWGRRLPEQYGAGFGSSSMTDATTAIASGGLIAALLLMGLLLSYIASRLLTSCVFTRGAAVLLIPSSLIGMMVTKTETDRLTVASAVFLFILVLADLFRMYLHKKDETAVVFLLPFLLIPAAAAFLIPISEEPFDWSGAERVIERIADGGNKLASRYGFGILHFDGAEIGFDGDGGLFGKVKNNNKEILEVSGGYLQYGARYLTGKIFADFDGRHWTQADYGSDTQYSYMMDTIETVAAVRATYPYNELDVASRGRMDITVLKMTAEYALIPEKSVVGARNCFPVVYEGDNVLFSEAQGYSDSYSVTFYLLNRGGEDLVKYHRDISGEVWREIALKYRPNGGKPYEYADLLDYRRQVEKYYGQRPECSDAVLTLIEKITSGASSDYEKLKAIESYLSSGTYTLEVDSKGSRAKSEAEFLDYFLTENMTGYCSYYATAFVLMARSIGLPARYVQGYRIPCVNADSVTVLSSYAHAWPEVYFEGVGWLRFEPTPGYRSLPVWGEALKEPEYYEALHEQEAAMADYSDDREEDDLSVYGDNTEPIHEEVADTAAAFEVADRLAKERRLEQERKRRLLVAIASLVAAGLVAAALLTLLLRTVIRVVRYRRMDTQGRFMRTCLNCFLILQCMGYLLEEGDTLAAYANNADTDGEYRFIELYERLLYSQTDGAVLDGKEFAEHALCAAQNDYRSLKKRLLYRRKPDEWISFFFKLTFETNPFA